MYTEAIVFTIDYHSGFPLGHYDIQPVLWKDFNKIISAFLTDCVYRVAITKCMSISRQLKVVTMYVEWRSHYTTVHPWLYN